MTQRKYSILIPTYNRASVLDITLEMMCKIHSEGIWSEIIIIDNNSNDDTRLVVEKYNDKLPVKYLFESRQGKNIALNKGICVAQGDILVFVDDDVTPVEEWLTQIDWAINEYPEVNIFGGKILTKWPDNSPSWVHYNSNNFPYLFSSHDLGDAIAYYSDAPLPGGANFWIRRKIMDLHEIYFNEKYGPTGEKRVAGSETEFLSRMFNKGEKILYIPKSVVYHRVLKKELAIDKLLRRFRAVGRFNSVLDKNIQSYRCIKGIPLFLFRQIFEECLKIIVFCIILNRDRIVNSAIRLSYFIGKFWGYYNRTF